MSRRLRATVLALFPILALAPPLVLVPAAPAFAERGEGRGWDRERGERRDERRGERSSGQGRSGASGASGAADAARRQTGGRVLGVTPRDGGYRVKVLTPEGEVRSVFVPER